MSKIAILLFVAAIQWQNSDAQRALGSYNVDPDQISISGLSSGADMATQFHVAHSSTLMGVGIVAGSPYYCAKGSSVTATNACMNYPNQIDVQTLIDQTNTYAASSQVDPVANMYDDKVYVFAGMKDTAVNPAIGQKVVEYYNAFVDPANIKTEFTINAEHGFPTVDYGVLCTLQSAPFINRCSFDGAFELLNFIYGGNLTRPTGTVPLNGDFYEFDQSEFFPVLSPPDSVCMDSSGYVYVPSGCMDGSVACRFHISFHGCQQGKYTLEDEYAMNTGYNEVGELNNIIILHPQAVRKMTVPYNPYGCWDWWGYNAANYATKDGEQIDPLFQMLQRVAF